MSEDERCFVRAVVVHDDVDLLIRRHAGIDAVQEFAGPFFVTNSLVQDEPDPSTLSGCLQSGN
jgi:hypothetical protein